MKPPLSRPQACRDTIEGETEIMPTPDNVSATSIPLAQILAFALTVIVSYLSARWATAESRKQFRTKTESDERAAAAELIPLLLKFALECDKKKGNLSTYVSSDGRDGQDESISGVVFDPAIHASAARLGPRVTERAIKLEMTKTRAEAYVSDIAGHVEGNELDQIILSFLALLSLRARYLVDMAAERAGLAMRHPLSDMERLLKESFKHAHEIDSADETKWY
jgi:hypothetical protein